jgi:hypothetical protein
VCQQVDRQYACQVRLAVLILVAAGCGGTSSTPDAADHEVDAATCVPGDPASECTNCVDDDGDGTIDDADVECTGTVDDDESSFDLGIPDSCETVDGLEDCAFDDNTGAGDDGCGHHVCCSLVECPAWLADDFDPGACDPGAQCVSTCAPLADAGCDCFGCCTLCDGATCRDVLAVTCISPECEYETFDDPEACLACIKVESCQAP